MWCAAVVGGCYSLKYSLSLMKQLLFAALASAAAAAAQAKACTHAAYTSSEQTLLAANAVLRHCCQNSHRIKTIPYLSVLQYYTL